MSLERCLACLACGLSERAARDHVRVGRSLLELPRIREAFGRGELSYSKVRALTRVATPGDEAELLELARHATTDQLERIVRAYRGCLDLDDARRAHAERFLNWSWEPDGSLSFRGRLPAEEASLFMRSLEAARDELTEQGWEAGTPEPAVTNADAAVLVAESYLANGPATRRAGERYQVVVRVDPDSLTGENPSGRCATEKPPSWIRRWCGRQSWTMFSSEVSPPSAQCSRWWPSTKRRLLQPGNRQPPSRASRARRSAGGTERVLRPTPRTLPSRSAIATIPASQASRRAVSAASGEPSSVAQRPDGFSPVRLSGSTRTTTW
jgi:hypothetical protein